MPFQAERAAIKIQALVQIFGKDANVREGFDHINLQ
jgi:hypothetical protein